MIVINTKVWFELNGVILLLIAYHKIDKSMLHCADKFLVAENTGLKRESNSKYVPFWSRKKPTFD